MSREVHSDGRGGEQVEQAATEAIETAKGKQSIACTQPRQHAFGFPLHTTSPQPDQPWRALRMCLCRPMSDHTLIQDVHDRVSLYLDPQIRDWVLFPITLVMVRFAVPAELIDLTSPADTCRNLAALCSSASPDTSEETGEGGYS